MKIVVFVGILKIKKKNKFKFVLKQIIFFKLYAMLKDRDFE